MSIVEPAAWTGGYAVLMFFMWRIMMVAMMLPGASPMILLHAIVARNASERAAEAGAVSHACDIAARRCTRAWC